MSLLRPASNEMAFAKVGIFAFAGGGKTYTASLIAVGLHKLIKSTKPVAFLDSETGSDFVGPRLFAPAGVPLLVAKTRSFKDLLAFMDEAQETSDIAIVDSVTHVWNELQAAFLKRVNENRAVKLQRLEFQHWRQIKEEWQKFADRFTSSKLHVIICGRAGDVWRFDETGEVDAAGKARKELIAVDTKMRVEGQFAFEPSLLIEMERVPVEEARSRGERLTVNRAHVRKDRADMIDGADFDDPTFESFLPHFQALNIGGAHRTADETRSSVDLFDAEGRSDWEQERKAREIACEEIQGLLTSRWPGRAAEDVKAKTEIVYRHFGTRSWTAVEGMQSARIRAAFEAMKVELGDKANA